MRAFRRADARLTLNDGPRWRKESHCNRAGLGGIRRA